MKIRVSALAAILVGLILVGCTSIPTEDDDEILSDSPRHGVSDPDTPDRDP